MERRRRERINGCLEQLKNHVLVAEGKDVSLCYWQYFINSNLSIPRIFVLELVHLCFNGVIVVQIIVWIFF
jgi:hypothetical protein